MEEYIILGAIALLVLSPYIIWEIYRLCRSIRWWREFVSKPFVCPNCGLRFYTQQRFIRPIGENKAFLKCPGCGKRDLCARPYDFDENQR